MKRKNKDGLVQIARYLGNCCFGGSSFDGLAEWDDSARLDVYNRLMDGSSCYG